MIGFFKKNKVALARVGFALMIVASLYSSVSFALLLVMQVSGAFVLVWDPYAATFSEVGFHVILLGLVLSLTIGVKYINKLRCSFVRRSKIFGEEVEWVKN